MSQIFDPISDLHQAIMRDDSSLIPNYRLMKIRDLIEISRHRYFLLLLYAVKYIRYERKASNYSIVG